MNAGDEESPFPGGRFPVSGGPAARWRRARWRRSRASGPLGAARDRQATTQVFGEALDLSSHRLDGWITSLASKRLQEMRSERPTGIHVGATVGWRTYASRLPTPSVKSARTTGAPSASLREGAALTVLSETSKPRFSSSP